MSLPAGAGEVKMESVLRRFQRTVPPAVADDAFNYYTFCVRVAQSDTMSELEDFKALFLTEGRREIESGWYAKAGALPLDSYHVRIAAVKCQLTCPQENMVKNICRFVTGADLDSLAVGKPKEKRSRECENWLSKFRRVQRGSRRNAPQGTGVTAGEIGFPGNACAVGEKVQA